MSLAESILVQLYFLIPVVFLSRCRISACSILAMFKANYRTYFHTVVGRQARAVRVGPHCLASPLQECPKVHWLPSSRCSYVHS